MKCLYFIAPTLKSTHDISEDLHAVGISDFYIHVISKDERGLRQQHVHSSNYLETLDIIRIGFIGAFLGFVAGLVGVELLRYFEPFGPGVPGFVYLMLTGVATVFGAWEGGLVGVGSENKKLDRFRDDISAGRYVILIYVRKQKEEAVCSMMTSRHTAAELVASDRFFMNPFSRVVRSKRAGPDGNNVVREG